MNGILVGTDESQEWLLPWWWKNYKEENTLPVAFADFGMSKKAKRWCKNRGLLLEIEELRVAVKKEIDPLLVAQWEKTAAPFWDLRGAWFKKPLAFLKTPFEKTIWLDLDCEVLGALEPLYDYVDSEVKMAICPVRDPEVMREFTPYSSGVVVFEKNAPMIFEWAQQDSALFLGDQDALSKVIFEKGCLVRELPEIYNWRMCGGVRMNAVVLHWAADWGKAYIRKYGGLRKSLKSVMS